MKISKKKVSAMISAKEKERQAKLQDWYSKRVSEELKTAKDRIARDEADVLASKARFVEAKKTFDQYKSDKKVPDEFRHRFQLDRADYQRVECLKRKIDLSEGDFVSVTDAELRLI